MFKSLTVTNFKAFNNPVTIDLSKTGSYEFKKEAIKDGIVKTALLYGKNASGKSSIGLAIFDIVGTLTDNHVEIKNYYNYKNLKSLSSTVSFTYKFIFDGLELNYAYTKKDFKTLISEKLVIGKKVLVDYDKSKQDSFLTVNMKGAEKINVEITKLNFSLLKYIKANCILKDNKENRCFIQFYKFVEKMILIESKDLIGLTPIASNDMLGQIIKNGQFSDLQNFFREAGIEDELAHENIGGREQLLIKYNDHFIDFDIVSSSGMTSLLHLYYWLNDLADIDKCPSLVFIDNYDAFYHFELSQFILENLKKAPCQVILTSHNTSNFSNDILRPDCYYICSKDKIQNAHNSTTKEIRFGNNLEKLYKGGAFRE